MDAETTLGCVVLSALVCACGTGSNETDASGDTTEVQCRSAKDCDSDQICRFEPVAARSRLLQDQVAQAPPRCTAPRACETDAECSDLDGICRQDGDSKMLVPPSPANCVPYGGVVPARYCVTSCGPDSCGTNATCEADGHCSIDKCIDDGAAPCPEYWACDADVAASTLSPAQLRTPGGLTATGAVAIPTEGPYQRGCVLLRCDDAGGSPCTAGYECDTQAALENSIGCVPVPCQALGGCSDDGEYICEPQGEASRPVGTDAHGCVSRNCTEGAPCSRDRICDAQHPEADVSGCRVLPCSEDSTVCGPDWLCDDTRPASDLQGCYPVSCLDGYECADSWTCEPGSELGNDEHGCAPPLGLVCPECILPEPAVTPAPDQPAAASTPDEPAPDGPTRGDAPGPADLPEEDAAVGPGVAPEPSSEPEADTPPGAELGVCR